MGDRTERHAWTCGLALLCCALFTAPGAALDSGRSASAARSRSPSVSSGLPWDGRLRAGVRLRRSAILRPVAHYARPGHFYGTSELVSMLERTAAAVAARWPGSQLAVGELSAAAGGKIDGHHSHRNGRDADVAFFMRDGRGRQAHFWRFVAFGIEGRALRPRRALYFDDARNWVVIAAMLRDPEARLQYAFVSSKLRTRLLMEGRRQGASEQTLRAAAAVLVQPRTGHQHDNHFHVRIYCPHDDRPECRDGEPYWPWYDGVPPGGRYAELPTIRWHMPDPAPAAAGQRASSAPRTM